METNSFSLSLKNMLLFQVHVTFSFSIEPVLQEMERNVAGVPALMFLYEDFENSLEELT